MSDRGSGLRWEIVVAGMIACLFAAVAAAAEGEERLTVFQGATVVDGSGAVSGGGWSIVVRGERILALVPDAQAPDPGEAEYVDVRGLYALPGLIDAHVHLATPPDARRAGALLRRQLYGGVTTVRSMADDVRSVAELSRQALTGEIPAPDIVFAALMAGPGFFDDPRTIAVTRGGVPGRTPWMQAIDEQTDLREAVALARGTSAHGIKVYADLPAATLTRIVEEAHRQGMPVWAHAAVFPALPMDVARAGADVMSHSCPLAYQVSKRPPARYAEPVAVEAALFEDGMPAGMVALFEEMAARGIVLDATNRVYVEHAKRFEREPGGRAPRCSAELTYRLTREAHLRGVPVAAGTDGEPGPEAPLPALHEELAILAGPVGMPAADVIAAATGVAARALGQASEIGSIEPGKLANLVFVAGDPLREIERLRDVVLTVKRGRLYPRSEYQALAEDDAARFDASPRAVVPAASRGGS